MLVEVVITITLILIALRIISKLTLGICRSSVCLIGKTALITGGNSGIGYETALQLAGRGCRVIIADKNNCNQAKENIVKETGNKNIVAKQFDLASLSSVRNLAKEIIENEKRLDILINNAGTLGLDFSYTPDGLHSEMQINHFGSFLLTHLLIDLLKASSPSRIIFVSSIYAYFSNLKAEELNSPPTPTGLFSAKLMGYCNTKLCNLITAQKFAEKLQGTGVTTNSVYPGVVLTPLFLNYYQNACTSHIGSFIWSFVSEIFKAYCKSPFEGAQTTVHVAVAKDIEGITGKIFMDCKTISAPLRTQNIDFVNQIWKLSENYVQLSDLEKLNKD